MDSQHINIIRMFHRFLPAKYQAHKFTSCFTTAPEDGNSSPNPLSRIDIVMVPASVNATFTSILVVYGGRSGNPASGILTSFFFLESSGLMINSISFCPSTIRSMELLDSYQLSP